MAKPVRIFRATKDKSHPYKPVSRRAFDSNGLSFEARGVLAYILMKPDDWEINVPDLMREGGIGRDKAYRIIDELIENGYAERVGGRGKGGKFDSSEIHIFEEAKPLKLELITDTPCTEKPDTAQPHTDLPDTVKPDTENQEHTKEGKELSKESTKKESNGATAPTPPKPSHHPAVQAYRELHERFPTKAQMKIICERDPPIADWVRAIRAWATCGYKPTNIEGMLEWTFNPNRITEGGYRNGNHLRGAEKSMAVLDEFEQKYGDMEINATFGIEGYEQ